MSPVGVLLYLGIKPLTHRACLSKVCRIGCIWPRRAGVCRHRTPVREAGFQHKWLPCVGRECFSNCVHLPLHIRHRPGNHAFFEYPHVPREEIASV